jgi:hypothetical protein
MEKIFKPEKEQMIYHFLNLFLFSGKKKKNIQYKKNKIIDYHTTTNFCISIYILQRVRLK